MQTLWTGTSNSNESLDLLILSWSASRELFLRFSLMLLRRFKSAKGSPHPDSPWEVFSFELIPFNAHYTILQADFFNGDRSEPAPPLPTYSWDDEKSVSFDPSTAWGTHNVRQALASVCICNVPCPLLQSLCVTFRAVAAMECMGGSANGAKQHIRAVRAAVESRCRCAVCTHARRREVQGGARASERNKRRT